MKLAPRIRLRTLFVLFFCIAVGLATYPDPIGALGPAVATAIIIGLVQQIRQLLAWRPAEIEASSELAFARRFAIVWRAFVVLIVSASLIAGLLQAKGLLQLPDHDDLWFPPTGFEAVLWLCLILAICSSVARWRRNSVGQRSHRWRSVAFWVIGFLVGTIVVTDSNVVQFMVHRACAGIEADIPVKFQRPGVYPNIQDEYFRTFWIAFAAVVSTIAAGSVLAWSRRKPSTPRNLAWRSLLFVLLLTPAALFCQWYYTTEYQRLSPELAGSGLAAIWTDWLAGAMLTLILVTAGAYSLSKTRQFDTAVAVDLSIETDRTAFHESAVGLALMGLFALSAIGTTVAQIVSVPMFPGYSFSDYFWIICSPMILLMVIAPVMAVFHLGWVRWRCRLERVAWKLDGVSRLSFYYNWAALALILSVGIPTLNAFAFTYWLSPFNFRFP